MNIKEEIKQLCKTKNAIILAHYYTKDEIQEVADYIGDSLALARYATTTDASILVMCGVNFMAETCKILCPNKKVLIPDLNAGCSLADSCNASDLKRFLENNKDIKVVSYVNTTAEVKALSYICVTSGNAKKIIDSFPKDEKLLFCPDKNLGSYINKVTGRNMMLWDGGCHVHGRYSREKIIELKETCGDSCANEILKYSREAYAKYQDYYTASLACDNETLYGWYLSLREDQLQTIENRINYHNDREHLYDALVKYTLSIPSKMTILPIQDILKLDNSARMNYPGTVGDPNWKWKLKNFSWINKVKYPFKKWEKE